MHATIDFDDDVAAVVDRLCHERGIDRSEAVNELIRRGSRRSETQPFRQITHRLGVTLDVSNVTDAINRLEGPGARP